MTSKFRLIGRGLYSLREAERLTGVPRSRIRRWTVGYTYNYRGESIYSPPVVAADLECVAGSPAVDFADLLEVRFLDAFRSYGVSMPAIRIAAVRAKELLGRHHPFSTRIFKTDGRTILAEIAAGVGDHLLLDLVKSQYAFERVIAPYLHEGIEFNDLAEPQRWWPLGKTRRVLLDPARAFGAPICVEGVPTEILAGAMTAERDAQLVSRLYDVALESVRDAVAFENRAAA